MEALGECDGGELLAALRKTRGTGVFCIEMVLARCALKDATLTGDLDALGEGTITLVGFCHGVQVMVLQDSSYLFG